VPARLKFGDALAPLVAQWLLPSIERKASPKHDSATVVKEGQSLTQMLSGENGCP
jgi:hypothetical protein